MHGFLGEPGNESDRKKVEVSVDEAFDAEFGSSVFPRLVLHHFFPDTAESGMFGQNGDIAVHLTIYLDAFDYGLAVSLETAVEVVELYPRSQTGSAVEEPGGDGFGDGVEPFLLPPRDHVVFFFPDHSDQFGNLVGTVLQVGIHSDDHLALCGFKTTEEGGRFPVIPAELDSPDGRVFAV